MTQQLDVKVHTAPHDITTDWTLLQQARHTAEQTEGVDRIIGLISADKMRTFQGGHCIVFRFEVDTTPGWRPPTPT